MTQGLICPVHQSPLVEREGQYGKFWGCPEFASKNCRYVYREGGKNTNAQIFVKLEVIESKLDLIVNYINERTAKS